MAVRSASRRTHGNAPGDRRRDPGPCAARLLAPRPWLLGARRASAFTDVRRGAPAHCRSRPRRFLRHERLVSRHLRRAAEPGVGYGPVALATLPAAAGGERARQRHAALPAHVHAAALACLAQPAPAGSLAPRRPLLPARSRRRGAPQPRGSHRRRCADCDRGAGRPRDRTDDGGTLGGDLHRGALDRWRRRHHRDRRRGRHRPGFPRGRSGDLRSPGERNHVPDRTASDRCVRAQESGRGGVPLRAHPPAR